MHRILLLFSYLRIRVNPKHKWKEGVDKLFDSFVGEVWKKLLQTLCHNSDGVTVALFEFHQYVDARVFFHIKMIHGHEFEKQGAILKRSCQCVRKIMGAHGFMSLEYGS